MSSETQRNRRKAPGTKPVMTPPDAGSERTMEILDARLEHLEAELEGLQDAIHRQTVLRDEQLDELDRRIEPHQIACALSQDARKRGVGVPGRRRRSRAAPTTPRTNAVQNVSVSASPASRPITRGAGSRARRARHKALAYNPRAVADLLDLRVEPQTAVAVLHRSKPPERLDLS